MRNKRKLWGHFCKVVCGKMSFECGNVIQFYSLDVSTIACASFSVQFIFQSRNKQAVIRVLYSILIMSWNVIESVHIMWTSFIYIQMINLFILNLIRNDIITKFYRSGDNTFEQGYSLKVIYRYVTRSRVQNANIDVLCVLTAERRWLIVSQWAIFDAVAQPAFVYTTPIQTLVLVIDWTCCTTFTQSSCDIQ